MIRNKIKCYLRKSRFMNYVGASAGKLIATFNVLKIKTSMEIFGSEKCKATFGFQYTRLFVNVNISLLDLTE